MFNSRVMHFNEAELRDKMKKMLSQCSQDQIDMFRRMYDPKQAFDNPVDAVSFESFDTAFSQIENTLKKKGNYNG